MFFEFVDFDQLLELKIIRGRLVLTASRDGK